MKILAIAPIMPQESDIEGIANSLSFLNQDFQLDFVDPLMFMEALPNEDYYSLWKEELSKRIAAYDAFLGFSFGGVILQQCFTLFEMVKKTIILFSTPSFADVELQEKLGQTIQLCKKNEVVEALDTLYQKVYYPNKPPQVDYQSYDKEKVSQRLIFGLERVLATNSIRILKKSTVNHLHLMGEFSNLVNRSNVIAPKTGNLIIVPKAGMRVLEDNQDFCKTLILERLVN